MHTGICTLTKIYFRDDETPPTVTGMAKAYQPGKKHKTTTLQAMLPWLLKTVRMHTACTISGIHKKETFTVQTHYKRMEELHVECVHAIYNKKIHLQWKVKQVAIKQDKAGITMKRHIQQASIP